MAAAVKGGKTLDLTKKEAGTERRNKKGNVAAIPLSGKARYTPRVSKNTDKNTGR